MASDPQITSVGHGSGVAGPQSSLPASVTVLHSPDTSAVGRSVPLGAKLVVGRLQEGGVDLVLDDGRVSRCHATLSAGAPGSFVVEDHASRNGTFVEGRRVEGTVTAAEGTLVRIGDSLLEVGPPPSAEVIADGDMVGRSYAFQRLLEQIDVMARTHLPVLIMGETGTGKELVARRLHRLSGRQGPLVVVNCGALPETLIEATLFGHKKGAFTGATQDAPGYFASADGGTLFLDEIGELPLAMQPRLLRALENGEISPVGSTTVVHTDARVVAATNAHLAAETVAGTFRADLYARLAGHVVQMPPLRQRRADIPLLARHFLTSAGAPQSLAWTANFIDALLLHRWPMNVRELKFVMQRLAHEQRHADALHAHHLTATLATEGSGARETPSGSAPAAPPKPPATLDHVPNKEELVSALEKHRGIVAELASLYGKDRKQIYRWLKKHGLDADDYRAEDQEP